MSLPYASASRLYVDSFVIGIDGDRELLISTERDGEYTEHLNQDDVNNVAFFAPVSTSHSDNWVINKSDTPIFYDETSFSEYEDAVLRKPTVEGYFSQKFYLYSDDDVYVTIDPYKTFLSTGDEENRDATFIKNERYAEELHHKYQELYGNKADNELSNEERFLRDLSKEQIVARLLALRKAMRFSILVTDPNHYSYTIIDPHKEGETSLGGILDIVVMTLTIKSQTTPIMKEYMVNSLVIRIILSTMNQIQLRGTLKGLMKNLALSTLNIK